MTANSPTVGSDARLRESAVVPRSDAALKAALSLGDALRPRAIPAPRAEGMELYCPFESGRNVHAENVQAASVEWARRCGLVETTAQRAKLERSRIAYLVAFAFRDAPRISLELAADWTTLFCLLDDHVEGDERGPLELAAYLASTLAAFRGETPHADDAIGRAFDDLSTRMLAQTDPAWVARFAAHVEDVFCGFSWEAINRSKGLRPSEATYRVMRVSTVGLRPLFLLGELCEGVELSEAHRSSAEIAELEQLASRAVGWANDIFTCSKEIATGEVHNLVLVLMDKEALSLHRAIDRAIAAHDAEVRSFLAVSARLFTAARADDDPLRRYVRMLECWISGHLDWSRETGRYAPPPAPRYAMAR